MYAIIITRQIWLGYKFNYEILKIANEITKILRTQKNNLLSTERKFFVVPKV